MNVGVLISGRGSNMVALARACTTPGFPARVAVVVSNVPDAAGLAAAGDLGLPTAVVDHRVHGSRAEFEDALLDALAAHDVEAVCLAGFMRLLTGRFVRRYPDRILNVHPSLLPAFPGLRAQDRALDHGVRFSGCTVHIVNEQLDDGPIVLQAVVPVEPEDTEESLSARILDQEHRIYPEALHLLAQGRLRRTGRRVEIAPAAPAC